MNIEEVQSFCKERGLDAIIVGSEFDKSMLTRLNDLPGITVMQQLDGRLADASREHRQKPSGCKGPRDRFGRLK